MNVLFKSCCRTPFLFVFCLFSLAACSSVGPVKPNSSAWEPHPSIAVFPVENLSGTVVPLKSLKESLIRELQGTGIHVLDERILDKFMEMNRVRYSGGMDERIGRALKKETGVDGVLIMSVELFSETVPPKVALNSRLISTGDTPAILWMDGVGLAGDDAPGILGIGLIEDRGFLLKRALHMLTGSLERSLSRHVDDGDREGTRGKFRPKIAFQSLVLEPKKNHTVAIIPFFNESSRKNAGDIMVLHFVRSLRSLPGITVIEPGLVRETFLNQRIIMNQGLSLHDAETLFALLDVDLVLTGKVLDYQDYEGIYGTPKVNFSAQLIERKSRKIIWSSVSFNNGNDGVFFFDAGKVNTAHTMAHQMVGSIGERVVGQ